MGACWPYIQKTKGSHFSCFHCLRKSAGLCTAREWKTGGMSREEAENAGGKLVKAGCGVLIGILPSALLPYLPGEQSDLIVFYIMPHCAHYSTGIRKKIFLDQIVLWCILQSFVVLTSHWHEIRSHNVRANFPPQPWILGVSVQGLSGIFACILYIEMSIR